MNELDNIKKNAGLTEGVMGDLGRKMTGRISEIDSVRRTAKNGLQQAINGLERPEAMFGDPPDSGEIYGYLEKVRKELIQVFMAIDKIK